MREAKRPKALTAFLRKVPRVHLAAAKRFVSKIIIAESGCWEWQGAFAWRGRRLCHGKFKLGTASRYAHRLALAWSMGLESDRKLPKGLVVHHKCNNARCTRPECLLLGTVAENNRDIVESGRHVAHKGVWNSRCKLTDEAVRSIRELASTTSAEALAEQFGTTKKYIREIVAGRRRAT